MTFKKSFSVGSKAQQYFEGPDALPVARVSGWIEERAERAVSRVALVETMSAFSRRVREKR